MKKCLLTLSLAFLFTTGVISQTNEPPIPTAPPATTEAEPVDVGTAIVTLLRAIFPDLNPKDLAAFITTIFVAARLGRKLIPNKYQTGKMGQILRHSSLEINPPKPEALKENPATNTPPIAPPVPPKE